MSTKTLPLRDILPREPLLLMGAGPVPISTAVAHANGVIINHLGETMGQVIDGLRELAQYVFQTESDKIIGVSGPSSAAMEMAIVNLLNPGRSALILDNGLFSHRWGEMAQRIGSDVVSIKAPGISPLTAEAVEKAFSHKKFDVVIVTHGETSSGVLTTELAQIAKVAKDNGALIIVDAVTTLGAMEFNMDALQVDAVIAGGQKALGSIPGISLVAYSDTAWKFIQNRKDEITHWCLDSKLAWQFWGHHKYHYTAPVPGILSLYEALYEIQQETLEARWARHQVSSDAMQNAIEAMGLELFVPKNYRLASVLSIKLPENINGDAVRSYMTKVFGVEIAGAFGHRIVRIGQMGEQCRAHNLFKTIYALGMAFDHQGQKVDVARAMAVLENGLAANTAHMIVS